ncbi:MAG TPA: sulfotransferase domain-containing protein [Anaerolineaceae bacterium]|nr:sulfotransferase domain-containing protein [Anaerolineaceae bacterium]HPN52224.1 sulfotransferase domain-containing protein [Anaerolineaceae bacterium]
MPYPNFLIIGAPKAGTTGLYKTLRQHPQIFLSQVKEPNFFMQPAHYNKINNREDYLALFANVKPQYLAVGEASVQYLGDEEAAWNIHQAIPDVRLIAVLRQPAERIYSHFLMYLRLKRETITDFATIVDVMTGVKNIPAEHSSLYIKESLYAANLRRYLALFPQEQFHISLYADWKKSPDQVVSDICSFLNVNPDLKLPILRDNKSGLPIFPRLFHLLNTPNAVKNLFRKFFPLRLGKCIIDTASQLMLVKAPPLDPELRLRLTQFFRDDILELQDLLDRDLSFWLS